MWHDCEEALRAGYLARAELPAPAVRCNARLVVQADAHTGAEVARFTARSRTR